MSDLEPRVRAITNEIIDEFIDQGQVEFVTEFAHMVPRLVVGELIGVPQDDNARFEQFFGERLEVMAKAAAAATPAEGFSQRALQVAESITEDQYLQAYFMEAIAARREKPCGDIMSDLAQARFGDGEAVPIESIVSMITLLYAAGGDANTPELMSNSMLVLLRRPDLMDSLRSDPSLVESFIEEVLRFDTPVIGDFRVALEDTSIDEVFIPKGSKVMVLYSSANHDPAQFDDPESFDMSPREEASSCGLWPRCALLPRRLSGSAGGQGGRPRTAPPARQHTPSGRRAGALCAFGHPAHSHPPAPGI